MKTAVSFYSFDQNVDIREACEHAKKAGYEEKAVAILNSLMTGLCIFMAIICGVLIKTNMF